MRAGVSTLPSSVIFDFPLPILTLTFPFFRLCLAQWKNSSGRTRGDLGTCPECREVVKHENRVIAIDHMIDAIMTQLGEDKKREREEKIRDRKGDIR